MLLSATDDVVIAVVAGWIKLNCSQWPPTINTAVRIQVGSVFNFCVRALMRFASVFIGDVTSLPLWEELCLWFQCPAPHHGAMMIVY